MLHGDKAAAAAAALQLRLAAVFLRPTVDQAPYAVCSFETSVTWDCFSSSETIRSRRTTVMDYFLPASPV